MTGPSTREERRSRFVRRYLLIAPKLTLALRHMSWGSSQDAMDIVQDVLVDQLVRIDKSEAQQLVEELSDSELAKYLAKTVRNRWIDRNRQLEVRERSYKALLLAIQPNPTPEDLLLDNEQAILLRRSIASLRPRDRELLEELLEDNSTLAEVARRRKIKLGTIYTQFKRAVDALKVRWQRQVEERGRVNDK